MEIPAGKMCFLCRGRSLSGIKSNYITCHMEQLRGDFQTILETVARLRLGFMKEMQLATSGEGTTDPGGGRIFVCCFHVVFNNKGGPPAGAF